ncbi:MAG: hypothetical protein E6K35_08340 [Gammaproteobacteria bacterium]|nr:MAG: hypothetical protein E6K47_06250 [Gammaproteobacteria bacterium]TLY86543.1 MAG: hypothetical protein E6K35_08340 [Gammaproteobacteria bacterium]
MRRAALLAMAVLGALSGWSLGPQAVMTLFDAGAHAAQSAAAHAAYDKQVADYRGTVLVAFQEVEDGLAALRQLQRKSVSQAAAVTATQGGRARPGEPALQGRDRELPCSSSRPWPGPGRGLAAALSAPVGGSSSPPHRSADGRDQRRIKPRGATWRSPGGGDCGAGRA